MKTVIVYYSRSGNTKAVAQELAKLLGADIEEIVDETDRKGALGYIMAGRDATLGKDTNISEPKKDPSTYDLVVVGTPIWAFTLSTPVKAYLQMKKDAIKSVAFFATQGGSGAQRAFKAMGEITGKTPITTLTINEPEIKGIGGNKKVADFVSELTAKLR
jgi:flavodoxin